MHIQFQNMRVHNPENISFLLLGGSHRERGQGKCHNFPGLPWASQHFPKCLISPQGTVLRRPRCQLLRWCGKIKRYTQTVSFIGPRNPLRGSICGYWKKYNEKCCEATPHILSLQGRKVYSSCALLIIKKSARWRSSWPAWVSVTPAVQYDSTALAKSKLQPILFSCN